MACWHAPLSWLPLQQHPLQNAILADSVHMVPNSTLCNTVDISKSLCKREERIIPVRNFQKVWNAAVTSVFSLSRCSNQIDIARLKAVKLRWRLAQSPSYNIGEPMTVRRSNRSEIRFSSPCINMSAPPV